MAFRGEFWTQNTLEHHSEDEECTLLQVLETCAPPECFLTKDQISSLILRAEAREHKLPQKLLEAYEKQMSTLSSMQVLEESTRQGLKPKDIEMMEKPTLSIQEEAQTLYVRRMMASECEQLQGFPKNWTLID
jgi:hypothetical protein